MVMYRCNGNTPCMQMLSLHPKATSRYYSGEVQYKELEKVVHTYQREQLLGIRHASLSASLVAAHSHLGQERIEQLLPAAEAEVTLYKEHLKHYRVSSRRLGAKSRYCQEASDTALHRLQQAQEYFQVLNEKAARVFLPSQHNDLHMVCCKTGRIAAHIF